MTQGPINSTLGLQVVRRIKSPSKVGDGTYTFIRISFWFLDIIGIIYFTYLGLTIGFDHIVRMVKSPAFKVSTWLSFYLGIFMLLIVFEIMNRIYDKRLRNSRINRPVIDKSDGDLTKR